MSPKLRLHVNAKHSVLCDISEKKMQNIMQHNVVRLGNSMKCWICISVGGARNSKPSKKMKRDKSQDNI